MIEKIKKLIGSPNKQDVYLGMTFLGKEIMEGRYYCAEESELFEFPIHGNIVPVPGGIAFKNFSLFIGSEHIIYSEGERHERVKELVKEQEEDFFEYE